MAETHTEDTFVWPVTENGTPLDYSFLEAAKKWNEEIPHAQRNMCFRRDYITDITRDSILFTESFPNKPVTDEEKNQTPIPIESAAFFRDYVLTVINSDYSQRKDMRKADNTKLPKRFGVDFFKNAQASISQAPESLSYYEKELYNTPAFQRFAAEYYWEAEFDRRCRILKETVLKCPPDQRIKQLGHILKFLDTQIGVHAEFAARPPRQPNESIQTFLKEFPAKLFGLRQKGRVQHQSGSKIYAYTFENLLVKTADSENKLSFIFPMIRRVSSASKPKKRQKKTNTIPDDAKLISLLKDAREQYLISLSSKTKESEFYTQAHELDSYLKSAATEYRSDTVQPIIKEIARQYYLDIFKRQNYPLVVLQKPITPDVTTSFLEGIVGSLANNFVFTNWADIQRLFPINEEFFVTIVPPDIVSQAESIPMESPDLFYRLFQKYIGREFSEYTDSDPNNTPLELLAALYYEHLFQLEFSAMTDSPDESFQTSRTAFQKQHNAYHVLCFLIRKEWNELLQKNSQAINQYIKKPDATFPCLGTYLHRLLFTIKLYSDYCQVVQLTEKCYEQYHSIIKDYHSSN